MSGLIKVLPITQFGFFTEVAQSWVMSADHLPVGVLMGTSITYDAANNASTPEHAVYSYFDTPSTTSQITYKVGVYQGQSATQTWYTNRTVGDSTNNSQYERGTSFISVTEIAG